MINRLLALSNQGPWRYRPSPVDYNLTVSAISITNETLCGQWGGACWCIREPGLLSSNSGNSMPSCQPLFSSICSLSRSKLYPNLISKLFTIEPFSALHASHVAMASPSSLLQTTPRILKPLQLLMTTVAFLRSAPVQLPSRSCLYDCSLNLLTKPALTARRMDIANTNWTDLRVPNRVLYGICANTRWWRVADTRDLRAIRVGVVLMEQPMLSFFTNIFT